jgi:hypothetical protein
MKNLSNYFLFHNFVLLLLQFLKIFGKILDSFEIWKFQMHNMKVMAKDSKVNITVTYKQVTV